MTAHERIVLLALLSLRSTREATRRGLREHIPGERQMSQREFQAVRRSLIEQGLVTETGRITPAGEQALEG